MGRGLIGCFALFLAAVSAFADPKIDSAINVFKQVQADAEKLKTFCAMSKAMEAAGESEDSATKTKINDYLKQLGPDCATSWTVFRGADQNSPEGEGSERRCR